MRIAVIYDCLFPWTVGGGERWYRNLAERLVMEGHEVSYLTLRQWNYDSPPNINGVRIIAVGPRMALYVGSKRRILPPLIFGLGIFWHFLWHGNRYDRLHIASFPFFSLLAVGLLRPFFRYVVAVDWFEVWSRAYWRQYLGALGTVGWWIQALCTYVPQYAFTFSHLHQQRLLSIGRQLHSIYLPGLYEEKIHSLTLPPSDPPTVVYAGRMIPEKRILLLVEALAIAIAKLPTIRATLFGNGPDRLMALQRVMELGLVDRISVPGFVDEEELDLSLRTAAVMVQPSKREGYGLIVIEAAARSVPSIVVASEDNAATELIEEGVNGLIVPEPTPSQLADAILHCVNNRLELRASTRYWYLSQIKRLSLARSLDEMVHAIESKEQ